MTPLARKFFIAALVYLLLSLLAQAISVFDVWLGFNPLAYTAIAATQQLFLLGWLTQLGLALIYDRWLQRLETSCPLGIRDSESIQNPESKIVNRKSKIQNPKSALLVFILFNIGLPLVIMGQPGLALFGGTWLGVMAALGAVLQFVAGLIFVHQAWPIIGKN